MRIAFGPIATSIKQSIIVINPLGSDHDSRNNFGHHHHEHHRQNIQILFFLMNSAVLIIKLASSSVYPA